MVMPVGRCWLSLKVSGAREGLTSTRTTGWRVIHSCSALVRAATRRCISRLVLPLLQRRRIFRRSLSVILSSALSTNRRNWVFSLAKAKAKNSAGRGEK
ncbi:hypothetical protein D3C76_1617210 [compost metagenome]